MQILIGKSLCQLHPGVDTGGQDLITPPPLRFQNSFSIALKGKKPIAKQESPKNFHLELAFWF